MPMLFSSKKDKKAGSSKRLTEAEIKRKLYGDYETESGGSHSSSHEVKMSGPAFESEVVKKSEADMRTHIAASALNGGVVPQSAPRPAFSAPKISSEPKRNAAAQDWKPAVAQASKVTLGFLAGILWKLGTYCMKALDFVLRLLDPRKPQARRLLYSIIACVLVAALFVGVFRLNSQRKKAMLGELPKPVSSAAVSVSSQDASPISAPSVSTGEANATEASLKEESQEMILKALENSSAVSSTAEVIAPVSEAVAGKYVIQVATYAASEDAARIMDSLKQAGFEAFFKKQIRNSTGHTFFTVYLGRYQSYSDAQEFLTKFRKASVARPFQDAFIRTLES